MDTINDLGTVIRENFSGSITYGTNIKCSDVDVRGIFIPHRKFLLGVNSIDQFDDKQGKNTKLGFSDDIVYFSLQKFVKLALAGNPNVVEQLFIKDEHLIFENEFGKELYDLRYEFITKNAYGRFGSYAYSQMKKMDAKGNHNSHSTHWDIIEKHGYDTKHAMHLIRLFQMGIDILKNGDLETFRKNHQELLDIRNGQQSLEYIKKYAEKLNKELESAMKSSTIPEYPDFEKINKWVIDVTDRIHDKKKSLYVFKNSNSNVLPLEYEMVDKCSLFTVSNKLIRQKEKTSAKGVFVPYKDWTIGLKEIKEFKFDKTSIDGIHKAFSKIRACDPKIIDILYASDKYVLYEHPMAKEFKEKMKTIISTNTLYQKTFDYTNGNLKKMIYWEKLKTKWEEEKDKKNLSQYPQIPKNTNPENSSVMTKFGYDTITAYEIVHSLKMAIELLSTGSIIDSRNHESELYAIKHAHYRDFEEFNIYVKDLLVQLKEAKEDSKLVNHNFKDTEEWLINFIDRFYIQIQ